MKTKQTFLAWLLNTPPMLLLALFALFVSANCWAETITYTDEWGDYGSPVTNFPSNTSSTVGNATLTTTMTTVTPSVGFSGDRTSAYQLNVSGKYVDISLSAGEISNVQFYVWTANNTILKIQFCTAASYDVNYLTGDPVAMHDDSQRNPTLQTVNAPSGAKSARIYKDGSDHWQCYLYYLVVTSEVTCTTATASFAETDDLVSGSAPADIEACEGSSITIPGAGSLTYPRHYSFGGWNDGTTTYAPGDSYSLSSNTPFTAVWIDNALSIPTTTTLNYANKAGGSSETLDFYDETCVNLYHTHSVEWDAYITPGSYQISMKYGAPYYGIRGTFSIIDPAGIESPIVFYTQIQETNNSDPIYRNPSVTYDLSGLTPGKLYIIKVEHDYSGSYLSIAHIEFTQLGASHTITFAKGDASVTGSLPADASRAEGGSYTLPSSGDLARVGYTFAGWNDGITTYAAGDSYTMPDEDVTFTAQWEPMVVPNVTGLSIDNPFNSNIPLIWSIPGICDLSNPVEPIAEHAGSTASYVYNPSGDYVTVTGTMAQYGQFGVGFSIPATTGMEWISFDYSGTLGNAADGLWGGVCDASYAYWHFEDPLTLKPTNEWQSTGQWNLDHTYWDGACSNPVPQSVSQVAIYDNTSIYGGSSGTFNVRNVRYHVADAIDIDHIVLMRKAGSAATGIDDAGATQLFSGTKSKYTDSEVKTVGTTYYYTVFSVHADGTVSSGATISKTITNDTPHSVTYAKGEGTVTGDVPTDASTYVEGNSVTLAAKGDLTRSGYAFMGWSDGVNTYAPGASYTMPDADVTFTAQWRDLEDPLLIPSAVTHLDANNYHAIPGGTYSFDVDGTGASTCIDIAGNKYAEWLAKFTPGRYRATLTYGTTGWAVNVTMKIYDGDTEVKTTTANIHSDGSGAHTYQVTWSLDLTDLDADKTYKVRVIDTYSDASSNPKVGYLDFELIVATAITNTASTRLDYANVSVSPGTTSFDIKNDGNSVTCLDIKDNGQADWFVTITPDIYDINMLYGTPEWSTKVTFSILDPDDMSTPIFTSGLLEHSGSGGTPWYEEKTWNNVDLSGLTAGKQYIVRVVDSYPGTGSKPKVQYVTFAKHELIQIGAFETVLNKDNTISTVSTVTDIDIDGDGNNDACMNLRNTYAEWEVNIAQGIYTMTLEYGVSTSSGAALKVQIDLIDPSGVEATRRLLYHYLSNDANNQSMAKIATRGCDFSEVTEGKRYIIRVSDVYGGEGCKLRVRNLSFEPFSPVQIPTTPRLNASNVFTPDVFAYNNFDVDGDDTNDECLYIRNHETQGVSPAEWKVNITPGIYKMNVVYGAPSTNSYDITVSLVDPEVGGEGTQLYTKHVSGSSGPERQNEIVSDIDWTNLTAGKEYIIRVASVNGSNTGNKLYFGSMSFERKQEHTRSGLRAGDFGTVCLPYAVAHTDRVGAELFEIESWNENGTSLTLSELTADEDMVAGRPYIYQATASTATWRYYPEGYGADAGEYNGLKGSYTQEVIEQSPDNYIIYNNKLYPVNSLAYVGAYRAYIHRTTTTPSAVARRRVTLFLNGAEVATGLDGVQSGSNLQKVLKNGQLFIIRGGKTYTVQGQFVK